jgi:hypothetical protein
MSVILPLSLKPRAVYLSSTMKAMSCTGGYSKWCNGKSLTSLTSLTVAIAVRQLFGGDNSVPDRQVCPRIDDLPAARHLP